MLFQADNVSKKRDKKLTRNDIFWIESIYRLFEYAPFRHSSATSTDSLATFPSKIFVGHALLCMPNPLS